MQPNLILAATIAMKILRRLVTPRDTAETKIGSSLDEFLAEASTVSPDPQKQHVEKQPILAPGVNQRMPHHTTGLILACSTEMTWT